MSVFYYAFKPIPVAGLTKKQQEKLDPKAKVQELKAKGYKQIEVADMLGVSLRTVKTDWK